jgi:hypothetical protein
MRAKIASWFIPFACLASLIGFLMLAVPAHGEPATITFSDPSCSSFTLAGTPPNQVLICNTAPLPPGGGTGSGGGTTTPPPPPPPPVVGTPGLERFDAVPGDSDWARWQFWQSSEFVPLQNRLVSRYGWSPESAYLRINQQINAYHSTMNVNGCARATPTDASRASIRSGKPSGPMT